MHKALETVSVRIGAQTFALRKGEPVDLAGLDAEGVAWLVAGGYVAPVKGELRAGETPEEKTPRAETRKK